MCYLEHKRYGTLWAFLFHRIRMSLLLPISPLVQLGVCSVPDYKYVGKSLKVDQQQNDCHQHATTTGTTKIAHMIKCAWSSL